MDAFKFGETLDAIWDLIGTSNKFIDTQAPWKLQKEGNTVALGAVLYDVLESARIVSVMITPFMPKAAAEIRRQLGLPEASSWEEAGEWGLMKPGSVAQNADRSSRG